VSGLPGNAVSISLAEKMWKDGKLVSTICHGPIALVNVKDLSGKNIVAGRKVTSFRNIEEEQVGMNHPIPFLVETTVDSKRYATTLSLAKQ
jgi:putative intracellular protease/amidase